QAEDGIRDGHVTVVQSCALPIYAPGIGQNTAFGAFFGAIGGIGPGFFPLPREPWSSRHPGKHSSSQCPPTPRGGAGPASRTVQKIGRASGRERGGAQVREGAGYG